jgi:hypothetical protein
MGENRFFTFVGRFNSLLFMAAGIVVLGMLCYAGCRFYADMHQGREATSIEALAVSGHAAHKEDLSLDTLKRVRGTAYLLLPLYASQPRDVRGYSGKGGGRVLRNILFINTDQDQERWLFDTNRQAIVRYEQLPEKECGDTDLPARAILYQVATADTNGDSALDGEDAVDLAVSLPDGKGYRQLLRGLDSVEAQHLVDNETLFFIYKKQKIACSAYLSLKDFSVQKQRELPRIGNGNEAER